MKQAAVDPLYKDGTWQLSEGVHGATF
jgi:hypothetical protein